jgi:hypothetical protein
LSTCCGWNIWCTAQDHPGGADLLRGEATHGLAEIPHHHLLQRDAHLVRGPAAQVLVREEQHLLAARESPGEHARGVGGGADDAAVLAAERLQVGSRVDVGDRGDELVGVQHAAELFPALAHLDQVGHVRHLAARGEVRQHHGALAVGDDVRDLGHEVHAAEHDELGIELRRLAREAQRIALEVRVLVDLGALVVMAQHDQALAQDLLGRSDPGVALDVVQDVELSDLQCCGHGFSGSEDTAIILRLRGCRSRRSRGDRR